MKNILLCFIECSEDSGLENYLKRFEDMEFEIHIFDNLNFNNIKPHNIPDILDYYFREEYTNNNFYLLSDVEDFIKLVCRIYNQSFKCFIYYQNNNKVHYDVKLEDIYKCILNSDIVENEIDTWIYTNIENVEIDMIYLDDINKILNIKDNVKFSKYYHYNNKYYLFEPIDGDRKIIDIDNSIEEKLNFFNVVIMNKSLSYDKIFDLLKKINSSKVFFIKNYDYIDNFLNDLCECILKQPYFQKNFYKILLEILSFTFNDYVSIFLNSVFLKTEMCSKYSKRMLTCALGSSMMTLNEKNFLMWQIIRFGFLNTGKNDYETDILIRKLYKNILHGFYEQLPYKLHRIPKNERDHGFVMVITGQFLGLDHGPTKTTLDRCYSLIKSMNKRVLLVNTRDVIPLTGFIPYFSIQGGVFNEDYVKLHNFNYKGIKIPFYQSSVSMPELGEIVKIIDIVKRRRPYFILNIGGTNIVSDLCNNVVPVITSATVMGIPISEGQFSLIGKKASEKDLRILRDTGKPREYAVDGKFTFEFKEQTHKYKRSEFNLPDDKFLILIVGSRLDYEVTVEFIHELEKTIEYGTHIVFAGNFDKYEELTEEDDLLKYNSTYLGFQKDMLAVAELCDVYVNPPRAGGQTSAAEAMYKGLPVVSLNYGDVSVCIGIENCVDSLEKISVEVLKLINNRSFYNKMSEKAKKRADELLDTDKELKRVLNIVENSELFF
ncbi:glycosyltransferase [Clostridium sp. LBM24168]